MDAKLFITSKRDAAIAELKAIEAEYMPRRNAAMAQMELTKKWMEELGAEKPAAPAPMERVPAPTRQVAFQDLPRLLIENGNADVDERQAEPAKAPSETWVSARDLQPRIRQAS